MKEEDGRETIRFGQQKQRLEEGLAKLKAQAREMGDMYARLGEMLRNEPETVGLSDNPMNLDYVKGPLFKQEEIHVAKIQALTNDIRGIMESLKKVNAEAKKASL